MLKMRSWGSKVNADGLTVSLPDSMEALIRSKALDL